MASHASSVLKSAVTASRLDAAPCLLQSDCNYSDKFSILEVFLFPFEKTFDAVSAIKFSKDHFWLGPLACIFYLLFVYAGPRYMKRRPAYDLRTPLRWWNLFCAVLSFWGMLRVVPHLWIYIRHVGMGTSLCAPPVVCFRRSAAGFWGTVFLYSKFFELLDTVFIVLRKRPLQFLHWYHHTTVLLCAWFAFIVEQPAGLHFCAMNYTVHTVMYFYYYLAMTVKTPPRWGFCVTMLQIVQMIAGTIITATALVYSFKYPFVPRSFVLSHFNPATTQGCHLSRLNSAANCFMYASYFYLFASFFYYRYVKGHSKKEV